MRSFADLPAQIDALADEREQLGVVLLDAFGWAFVQRHAGPSVPAAAGDRADPLAVPLDHHRAPDHALQRASRGGARALRVALLRAAGGRRDPSAPVRSRAREASRRCGSRRASCCRGRACFERRPTTVLPAAGDRRHAVRLGGAQGRARRALRDVRGWRARTARDAGAELPLLGSDRRRRAPLRAVVGAVHQRVAARAGRAGEGRDTAARDRRPRTDRRDRHRRARRALARVAQPPATAARRVGAGHVPARRRPRDRRPRALSPRRRHGLPRPRPLPARRPAAEGAPGRRLRAARPPAGWSR